MTLIELIIFASVGSIIGGIIFGSAINGAWFGIAFITIYYSRFLRRSSNPYYWLTADLNYSKRFFKWLNIKESMNSPILRARE